MARNLNSIFYPDKVETLTPGNESLPGFNPGPDLLRGIPFPEEDRARLIAKLRERMKRDLRRMERDRTPEVPPGLLESILIDEGPHILEAPEPSGDELQELLRAIARQKI